MRYVFDLYPSDDPAGKISETGTAARLVRLSVDDQLEDAEFWPSLYGFGKGFLLIHGDHPDAQYLHRRAWVAVIGVDDALSEHPITGFSLSEGDFQALSRKEDRGRVLKFQGNGGREYFERYVLGHSVYAPGQTCRGDCTTTYEGSPSSTPGKWDWVLEPPGAILVRLLEEGQNAPGAPYAALTHDFTRTRDSNNLQWLEEGDYQVDIGTSGRQVEADQVRRGLVVQVDAFLNVSAYRDIGDFRTDRTNATFAADKVRLAAGHNIFSDLPKKIAASRERTHVLMRGRTGDYQTVSTDTSGAALTSEPFYDFISSSTTANVDTLTRMGQVYLTRLRTTSDQAKIRHRIGPGGVDGAEGYTPAPDGDYWLGDLVTLHTGTGEHDYDNQPIEVAAIRYFLQDHNWMVEVELGGQYISPTASALQDYVNSTIRPSGPALCRAATGARPASIVEEAFGVSSTTTLDLALAVSDLADDAIYVAVHMLNVVNAAIGSPSVAWHPAYVNPGTPGAAEPLTSVVSASWATSHQLAIYRLLAPTAGTGAIRIQSSNAQAIANVWYVRDVDQSTPEADTSSATGASAASSSVAHSVSGLSLDAGGWRLVNAALGNPTPGSGQTLDSSQMLDNSVGLWDFAMGAGHGGSSPLEWDFGGTVTDWAAVAVSVAGTADAGGGFSPNDGHADLVGTSPRAARCDHRHDVHRDTAPTVNDDWATAGYKLGTIWARLDDLDNPTEIIGTWMLVDVTTGAAVWAEFGGGHSTHDAADIDYDNTASGLTATDVQAAIDELEAGGSGPALSDDTPLVESGSGSAGTSDEASRSDHVHPADGGGGGGGGGSRIGTTSIGGSTEQTVGTRNYAKSISVPGEGVILSVAVYTRARSAGANTGLRGLLYENNAGAFGRVLASVMDRHVLTNASGTPVARWVHIPLGVYVPAAGTYWVGIQAENTSLDLYYDAGGSDRYHAGNFTYGWDGGYFAQTDSTRNYSIHAIFLPF